MLEVAPAPAGYRVVADGAAWQARHVVIATGPAGRPRTPAAVRGLADDVHVLAAAGYRSPDRLPEGGVLVVGASASGAQIADELARAGRRVVLAVGSHTRVPRRYRGLDVHWWLDQTGRQARTIDTVTDPVAARREPSFQLAGREPGDARGASVDLNTLQAAGVELTGRLRMGHGHRVGFADDLAATAGQADGRLARFLDLVDAARRRAATSRPRSTPRSGRSRSGPAVPGVASTSGPRASGRCCWPPGTPPTTRG